MMAEALEANGAARVYVVGRRMETLELATKKSVSREAEILTYSPTHFYVILTSNRNSVNSFLYKAT